MKKAKNVLLFKPTEVPPELKGITAEFLADLNDLVKKFGIRDADYPCVRRLSMKEPKEIYVAASTDKTNPTTIVAGAEGVASQGSLIIRLTKGIIVWDKRVGIDDVRDCIAIIDAFMRERGFINENGERRQTNYVSRSAKFSVDSVFATPASIMPLLPGMPDAETMRQQFDKPEEVAIFSNPLFPEQISLCHKRDIELIRQRQNVVKNMLEKRGLATQKAIANLSIEELVILRAEIKRLSSH